MKTIAIIHHTGEWGGGTKSLVDLCEMLRDDYRVIVCFPKGYPSFREKIQKYGCQAYELKTTVPFLNVYSGRPPLLSVVTLRSLQSLRAIRQFGDEILSLHPDVVIFNTIVTAVSCRYLSKFTEVICIDRETMVGGISKRLYRSILDGKLNAITFLSEYERNKLGFQRSLSAVFPDCVRMDALAKIDKTTACRKHGIPEDKYAVLFMGGLAKIKGTDVILEAMDYLDDRFMLIFAGAMDESKLSRKQLIHDAKYPGHFFFKKRVKKYYQKIRNSPRFFMAGLCDPIDDLIIASDIVVFPSTSVHQPRPCIEAGAYEKPVILSDYEETAEYFRDGFNALTFTPGDAKALAEKILLAHDEPEKMDEMGKKNRMMTETKHDYYACKEAICSLIEKVCEDA